ncbi:MAG TPA: CPBP family intramembrane glutamic endopeptidase [Micromonosporaceae bacterium]|nr:CPBP family intramembrane glutamic endopeptidase [Micromonosporaceae bacterium]
MTTSHRTASAALDREAAAQTTSVTTGGPRRSNPLRDLARRNPVGLFLAISIGITWPAQFALLVAGQDLTPALLLELIVLLGGATLISAWTGGRAGVRRLYAGVVKWRIGFGRFLVLLVAMPALTLLVGAVTGTLRTPPDGWVSLIQPFLLSTFVVGVLLGNTWEETAWGGFVQGRLMARRGLLVGSLLTAVPFFLIHLPLAFADSGWKGTTWGQAGANWALLAVTAVFFRYLAGTVLVDTGGSVLAIGLLHAAFNASGSMAAVPGGWQYVPAVMVLTVAVAAYRRWRGRSFTQGYAPDLAPIESTGSGSGQTGSGAPTP